MRSRKVPAVRSTSIRCRLGMALLLAATLLPLLPPARPSGAAPTAAILPFDLYHSFLWGAGTEADQVGDTAWAHDTPLKILTCWFNRPEDLAVFKYWHD